MAGPTRLGDGTIISANLPVRDQEDYLDVRRMRQHGIYKAIILDTYFTDNDLNVSKVAVEYRIRIVGSEKAGYEYTGARTVDSFGDTVNFGETVLQKKNSKVTTSASGTSSDAEPPENYDNAYVMVQFLGGYRIPVIVGPWPHPRRTFLGATEDKGVRLVKEFNGVRWEINKDGEMIFTYYGGPRTPIQSIIPRIPGVPPLQHPIAARPDTAPTQIKIDQAGNLSIRDKELNEIKLDRENQLMSFTQYTGQLLDELPLQYEEGYDSEPLPINFPVNEVKLDKANNKISITNYEVGGIEKLKAEIDGSASTITLEDILTQAKAVLGNTKLDITTGAGTQLSIDGVADEIKAKAVIGDELTVSGPNGILAKASTGSTLKLALGKIGLGGPAGELVEEFEKLLTQLDTLLTQMQTETHTGNLGYPTSPPTNAPAYAAVQAQIAVIKTIIGLLKGGI